MNAARRKEISTAIDMLQQALGIVENAASEERDCFDNLPEGLQDSERGQRMSEIADVLEEAASSLSDISDQLNDAAE